MSATQPITEQRPLSAQDSLSKWVVFCFDTVKLHNLSQFVTQLFTGLQIGTTNNILECESRFTFSANAAKNIDYIEK